MENIVPLLLLVAYIVIALLKKKNPEQGAPTAKPSENQTPQPKPVDLETIFEDFFGKGKQQPQYQDDEELLEDFDQEPVVLREPTAIERAFEKKGHEYGSFQSEPTEENVFQQHVNKTKVGEDYEFSKGYSSLMVDDNNSQDSFSDSDSTEFEGDTSFSPIIEELDDFSPRDAVIYSEIINRKY